MANKTKAELEAELQLLQQSQQVQPTQQVGFWQALGSLFNMFYTLANAGARGAVVIDKTIVLAENEVGALGKHQEIRMERIEHEQKLQRVELAKKLAKA